MNPIERLIAWNKRKQNNAKIKNFADSTSIEIKFHRTTKINSLQAVSIFLQVYPTESLKNSSKSQFWENPDQSNAQACPHSRKSTSEHGCMFWSFKNLYDYWKTGSSSHLPFYIESPLIKHSTVKRVCSISWPSLYRNSSWLCVLH